jgi:hypothetical protein
MAGCVIKLGEFFKKNRGKKFKLEELTKNKETFIPLVQEYQNARLGSSYPDIEFNNDYTRLKVY